VLYERDGSVKNGIIVARTPTGERTLARVPASNVAAIAFLTDGADEPIGAKGRITADADGMQIWST
jgi:acetyl-CoA C-acetyltransferase